MTSGERRTGRFLASLLGAALVASLLAVATPAGPAKAVGETLVTPAATRVVPNTSGAALSDDFNIAGYQSGDTLLTNVSLSGPSGTSFSIPTTTGLTLGFGYSTWTGRTDLSFTGNQANTNAALDSMTVSTGATSGTAILTVSTTLSTANTYYYSTTGHFYQAVSSSGITWTNANTAATGASYKGRPGYLVTITSPEEQNFLNNNVSGNNIWIGL
ncbi:MAG: hypothetical protein EBU67_11270, partial [Actinobacteria bacterium]|nr:hypothetical protein [Actinomycetota bacterium]